MSGLMLLVMVMNARFARSSLLFSRHSAMSAKHALSDEEPEVEAEEYDAKRAREEAADPVVPGDPPQPSPPLPLHHVVIKPCMSAAVDCLILAVIELCSDEGLRGTRATCRARVPGAHHQARPPAGSSRSRWFVDDEVKINKTREALMITHQSRHIMQAPSSSGRRHHARCPTRRVSMYL